MTGITPVLPSVSPAPSRAKVGVGLFILSLFFPIIGVPIILARRKCSVGAKIVWSCWTLLNCVFFLSWQLHTKIKTHYVPEKKFLEIANGASLTATRKALGIAARHAFTIAERDGIDTLIECHVYRDNSRDFANDACPFFILYRDDTFVKVVGIERVWDYTRPPAQRPKEDLDHNIYIKK